MARSVEMFGQTRPIVIDENKVVLAGNGLLLALQRLGIETADVFKKTGLSDADKKKLMLADNKVYTLGVDDPEAQFALIEQIIGTGEEMDFSIPGFDEDVLKAFAADEEKTDDIVSNYGKDIPKGEGNGQSSFLDQSSGNDQQGQGAGSGNDQSGEQPNVAQKEGSYSQVRCPHCGEMIWV